MTTTKNRFLYLATATVLGLTLAACSGGDSGETDTGAADDTTTTEQTDSADETTDGGETAEETEDTGAVTGAGAECLVGTWEMTAEAMEEQVLTQMGGQGEVSVEGTSTMTFDGTTVTSDAHNKSSFSSEVEGVAIEGETITDGTLVVNYTADDTTLTYGEVVSAEGTITMTLAGQSTEQDFADTASLMSGQTQNYTCTDTELTLSTDVAGTELSQTFTRS